MDPRKGKHYKKADGLNTRLEDRRYPSRLLEVLAARLVVSKSRASGIHSRAHV